MDWKRFFKVFLISVIGVPAAAAALLGFFAFLIAGKEGFINGVIWGLVLGAMAIPFAGYLILPKYWGDFAGRYSKSYFQEQLEGKPANEKNKHSPY
jgi:hypothetical protein